MAVEQNHEAFMIQLLKTMESKERPVILFGTMALGRIALKAMKALDIDVQCFVDNNTDKQGNSIEGIPIVSTERAQASHPQGILFICSFNKKTVKELRRDLAEKGFENVYGPNFILWAYQLYVMKRNISSEQLANTLFKVQIPNENLILKNVLMNITEYCTLRCQDCAGFIQYIEKPRHYDKDVLIQSMKKLSESVDAIEVLSILGGEPLLHPDIAEICEAASKLKNVGMIRLVTNGTVVPDQKILTAMSHSMLYVALSDYGDLSSFKGELIETLEDNGVFCESDNPNLKWFQIFKPEKYHRSQEANQEFYETCVWRSQSELLQNGEFHSCGYSGNGHVFNFFNIGDDEYVSLMDEDKSIQDTRNQIKNLVEREEQFTACDYCDIHRAMKTSVERAIQTDHVLKIATTRDKDE